jgi:hypothetical protein
MGARGRENARFLPIEFPSAVGPSGPGPRSDVTREQGRGSARKPPGRRIHPLDGFPCGTAGRNRNRVGERYLRPPPGGRQSPGAVIAIRLDSVGRAQLNRTGVYGSIFSPKSEVETRPRAPPSPRLRRTRRRRPRPPDFYYLPVKPAEQICSEQNRARFEVPRPLNRGRARARRRGRFSNFGI